MIRRVFRPGKPIHRTTSTGRASEEGQPGRVDPADERGTTLSEVVVTMAIAAAISIPLMAVLQSSARHDANQEQQIISQSEIWRASDQIVRDIRLGTLAPALASDPLSQTLPLLQVNPDGTRTLIQWEVSASGLIRHTSNALAGAKPHSVLVAPAVVVNDAQASFVYLTSGGEVINPTTAPQKLIACTARVEIHLQTVDELGLFESNQSSGAFRVNPEGQQC